MHDLSSAVWTNKTLKKLLPELPEHTYLVGGCVRDFILSQNPFDFDLVTFGDTMALALRFGEILGGKAFLIDRERKVARVAMDNGNLTIDISSLRGNNIEADLFQRDITINAMAFNPVDATIIDPLDGQRDIREKQIRLISEKNLLDDPLRGLRCLRFAVQLKYTIDPSSMELIRQHCISIKNIAPERIKHEFLKAICSGSSMFLRALMNTGYAQALFGVSLLTEDMTNLIAETDRIIAQAQTYLPGLDDYLDQEIEHGLTRSSALGLAAMFVSMSKAAKAMPDKEHTYLEKWCYILSLSTRACRIIATTISGHNALAELSRKPGLKGSDMHRIITQHSQSVPEMLLLNLASDSTRHKAVLDIWDYYKGTYYFHINNPLINGNDIIDALCIDKGPMIGTLLDRIALARADGLIIDRLQALQYIRSLIH